MEENQEQLKYDYVGYAGIGKRDSKEDVLDSLPKQESPEQEVVKPITEAFGSVADNVHQELAWHSNDSGKFAAAGPMLSTAAAHGHSHHEILSAANHLPKIDHPLDSHLHSLLSSAPEITPEIHHQVFAGIAKANKEATDDLNDPEKQNTATRLGHKYSWVMSHSAPGAESPEHHLTDYKLDTNDLKSAGDHGVTFTNGRHVKIPGIGLHAFMNKSGRFEPTVSHSHSDVKIPELDYNSKDKELYRTNDDLERHYSELHNSKHLEHIRTYTGDSVAINKSAANINMGYKDPTHDGDFHDHRVAAISKAINQSKPITRDIHVFAGLSRSSDPSNSGDTDGKKTTFLPAFTSTSLEPRLAVDFSKGKRDSSEKYGTNPKQPISDVLHIKIPAGSKHGIYVNDVSENAGEHEFILDHGSVIKHDAEPTITSKHGKLIRIWKNGEVIGKNQSKEWGTRQAITSPEVAENHYFNSIRHSVRTKALESQHSTDKMLDHATRSDDEHLTASAIKSPNLKPEHIDNITNALVDTNLKSRAIKHPNATSKNITNAINDNKGDLSVAMSAAESPNLASEHIEKLLKYNAGSNMVRNAIALNPKTPDHVIKKFAEGNDTASTYAKHKLGITESEINQYMSKVLDLLKG